MNIRAIHAGLCAAIVIASPAAAQTQQRYYPQAPGSYPQPQYSQPAPPPNYPPQAPKGYAYPQPQQPKYENPIQFLPKFGKRMSEMVRRIFYGQDPTGYDQPPQGYGPNGGYSLDSSPRQSQAPNYPQQQQGQAQPRYNYPPQQQPANPARNQQPSVTPNKGTAPAPTTQSKSSASNSTRKYSPPKVTESPPKTPSKPSTTHKKEPVPNAPPPTTTRRSESTPKEQPTTTASNSASGSFLKGKKTAKPGRVTSPYPPYKELDITGLESGSLALDPTTQKVFEVP